MDMDRVNLILQRKPALTLLAIGREGGTYASVLSREIESTFAHTTNILSKLEEQGLVKFEPDGSDNRVKRVELTPQGERAAALVEELMAVLEGKKPKATQTLEKKPAGELASKLRAIQTQIELISTEEIDGKDTITQEDYVRIGRRLGPYRRELRKIMEQGDKNIEKKARGLDEMIQMIFEKRKGLRK